MAALLDIALRLPPGVTFTMWKDGSVHIRCSADDVLKTRDQLELLGKELTTMAVRQLELERKAEIERQRMPESKLLAIDTELRRLKGELPDSPEVIEVPIPAPVVQVSSVTIIPEHNGASSGMGV